MHRKAIALFVLGWLLGVAAAAMLQRLRQGRERTVSPLTLHDLDADVGL